MALLRLTLVLALISSFAPWSAPLQAAPSGQQAPPLTVTKTAQLLNDADGDGRADPGDTLRYTISVTNTTSSAQHGVVISDTLDAALSLVRDSVAVSPLAVPDSYEANSAAPLEVAAPGLLANDDGLPAPGVEARTFASAQGGTVELRADGSFRYSAPAGFSGQDTFQYRVSNSVGSDQALVTITVRAGPAANDDRFVTPRDQPLLVSAPGVLANDSGTAPLSVQPFTGATAQGGSVILSADGAFTYTPPSGFTGDDSFSYTAQNAVGSDQATVTITVGLAPRAVDDSGWTAVAGRTLSIPATNGLLSNDDRGLPAALLTSFGGGALGGDVTGYGAGSSASFGDGGALTVGNDGAFSFTPPATFSGTFTFSYRLRNELGFSDATVTIVVQRPPQAVNDGVYRTDVEQDLRLDAPGLLSNDTLGDPPATLVSFGGGALGGSVDDHAAGASVPLAGGTLTVGADGALTLTTPTQPGSYTFQYRLSNAAGASTATVTIVVQAPPLANDDSYSMLTGATLQLAASDNGAPLRNDDRGVPPGTIASFGGGALGGDVTSYDAGAVVPLAGGSLSLTPDGALTLTAPTQPGTYTFQYRLSNVVGDSDATITIVIQALPRAVDDGYAVTLGQTLSRAAAGGLLANDDPGSPAGTLVSFGGGSLGGSVTDHSPGTSVTIGSDGALTVNADGSFSFTPPSSGSGDQFQFRYRLANSLGASDALVTIAIQRAPQAQPDSYTTVRGATLTVDAAGGLLSNDGLGNPPATLVSFGGGALGGSVDDHAAGASVPLAGGMLTVGADGALTLTTPTQPGSYTFQYRLSNAAGASTATVTITVQAAPGAVDDGPFRVAVNETLTIGAAGGLLSNDGLGNPPATLVSFGGGSLGGSVDDHAAGASVPLAGGMLTVGADGALTLTTPTQPGSYTFQYRLSNAAGAAIATVTIEVVAYPVAVDDSVAADSAPGAAYHTALNTTLTISSADATRLLANDTLGAPPATLVSFGAIQLAQADGGFGSPLGDVSSYAAGQSVDLGNGGMLTVNADGSLTLVPPRDYTGLLRFAYRLANSAGSDDALVTLAVGTRPQAIADSYPDTLLGNVWVDSAARGFSVLSNDRGDGLSLGSASSSFGDVTLRPDGTFVFDPRPGYEGAASFSYTLRNGFGTVTGTVSLRIAGMIWFIDNSRAGDGDGRLSAPFNRLESFQALNDGQGDHPAAGDVIFLYSGVAPYSGGIRLLDRQRLIGQGASSDLPTLTGLQPPIGSPALPTTGGASPVLGGASLAIEVAADNAIHGLRVGDTTDSDLAGTAFGTLTIRDVDLTGQGRALNLVNGTLDARFGELSAGGSASDGARLVDVAGGLEAANGTLAGGAGSGLWIERGALTFTYGGSVTQQNDAPVIVVADTSGGAITISGGASGSGNQGLLFTGNRATISLGSVFLLGTTAPGLRLNGNHASVTLSALNVYNSRSNQAALVVGDNAGALTIGDGTLTSGTAGAVAITNAGATPTPLDVTLSSVSSNGAATSIQLQHTGGSFTVQGRGRADSGGVIQNATAPAIVLQRAQNVTLRWLRISGQRDLALSAAEVSNLALSDSVIQGARGTPGVGAQSGLALTAPTGTLAIERVRLADVTGAALAVSSTLGSLNLQVRDSQISTADEGIVIQAAGISQAALTISGNTLSGIVGDAIALSAAGENGSVWRATLADNRIGRSDQLNSGTLAGDAISITTGGSASATRTLAVLRNQIAQYNGDGIAISTAGAPLEATVQGNLLSAPGSNAAAGIVVRAGAQSSHSETLCADVRDNAAAGVGRNGAGDVTAAQQGSTTLRLPGYIGARDNVAQVAAFLEGNNVGATASVTIANPATGVVGGPACAQPLLAAHGTGRGGQSLLTQADLEQARVASLQRWAAYGLAPQQMALLAGAPVEAADLEAGWLGQLVGTTIMLDPDAAGWGWATRSAQPGMDLLSVLLHEQGHLLGLDDQADAADGLMAARLRPGEQRTPTLAGQVASATVTVEPNGLRVELSQLPAGKVVSVIFDVVIADPLPEGVTQVSNQALVTADGVAATRSDDPTTATPGDPTVTPLDGLQPTRIFLPLVSNARQPDLVPLALQITPQRTSFAAGEPVQISVTVANQGTARSTAAWVDLYINPVPVPEGANLRWNDTCSLDPCFGIVWALPALEPGQQVTLTSSVDSYAAAYTRWPGWFAAGTSAIYVYVDSWNPGVVTGAVSEANESNNRIALRGLSVTGTNPKVTSAQHELPAERTLP